MLFLFVLPSAQLGLAFNWRLEIQLSTDSSLFSGPHFPALDGPTWLGRRSPLLLQKQNLICAASLSHISSFRQPHPLIWFFQSKTPPLFHLPPFSLLSLSRFATSSSEIQRWWTNVPSSLPPIVLPIATLLCRAATCPPVPPRPSISTSP
jgi:hypothetical protein